VLIPGSQLDFRSVALYLDLRAKGLRGISQALENITSSRACYQRGQAARVKELVVSVFVVNIGLALAHVVQRDRPERNRMQVPPLKLRV